MAAVNMDGREREQSFSPVVDADSRLRCVLCNTLRPRDGKLLKCLHLMCLRCAGEFVTRHGHLLCCVCGVVTKVVATEERNADGMEELLGRLPNGPGLLYSSDRAEGSASGSNPEAGEKGGPIFCFVCEEMDEEQEASHQCVDCGGRPLCSEHAETHPKRRYSRDHDVISMDQFQKKTGSLQSLIKCCTHPGQELITYCQSCSQSLCAQCLSSAHGGHMMETLGAEAEKRLQKVKESLQLPAFCEETESDEETSSADEDEDIEDYQTEPRQPAILNTTTDRLTEIAEYKTTLESEALQASFAVAERFDEIERRLKERRCELESEIEHELWSGLGRLEDEERKLRLMQHSYTTAMEVKEKAESCGDCALAIPLLECVDQQLLYINSSFQEVSESEVECRHISARIEALEEVESAIADNVTVETTAPVDLENCWIYPEFSGLVGHMACQTVTIVDSEEYPVSADYPLEGLNFKVISPSDEPIQLKTSRDTSEEDECAVKIVFTPEVAGEHTIEMFFQGKSRPFPFPVLDTMHFDPEDLSNGLVLSNGNRTAEMRDDVVPACVRSRAAVCFGEGFHEWEIQYSGVGECRVGIYAGSKGFRWSSTGKAYARKKHLKSRGMSPWQDGDIIGFKLDCDARTLECHHHRTGEKKTIKDVDFSDSYLLVVWFFSPGCQVSFC